EPPHRERESGSAISAAPSRRTASAKVEAKFQQRRASAPRGRKWKRDFSRAELPHRERESGSAIRHIDRDSGSATPARRACRPRRKPAEPELNGGEIKIALEWAAP